MSTSNRYVCAPRYEGSSSQCFKTDWFVYDDDGRRWLPFWDGEKRDGEDLLELLSCSRFRSMANEIAATKDHRIILAVNVSNLLTGCHIGYGVRSASELKFTPPDRDTGGSGVTAIAADVVDDGIRDICDRLQNEQFASSARSSR